ncbi:MAG: precorrin-2/cobalt-factor-2 C20-methyltransferase [Rhodospirillaceae bacterium]|nr:MAG: precorrin-2/cobalt-factor-2 C20-methyltransferase [Rhodospirillaceae bacterium]
MSPSVTALPAHSVVSGTLWGVGVGPGDPELLTLKAVRVLRAAPVIAYLAPLEGKGLARRIAAAVLEDGIARTEIALRMRFTVDRHSAQAAYDHGAAAIAGHLVAGRDVAVLCEGDPLFFGSFAYIMARLEARFPVEVIPGVGSLAACSAALRQAFALLDDRAAVIPASRTADEITATLAVVDAAAIIKVGRHLAKVAGVLERLGLLERAWHVERASQPEARVRPLTAVMAETREAAAYFSMVLVYKGEKTCDVVKEDPSNSGGGAWPVGREDGAAHCSGPARGASARVQGAGAGGR